MSQRFLITVAAGAVLLATVGGCSPTVNQRGFVADGILLDEIRPGVDNRNSVSQTLGRPTATATFGDNTWYYISRTEKQLSFFRPDVMDQRIVAVHFDGDGLVSDINTYTLADARNINPADGKTPTRGKELGFWEQIFGNIGRFSGAGQGGRSPQPYQN